MALQSNPLSVGFIGLGDQGLPMARAVAQAGYALHVWARRSVSYQGLADVAFIAEDSVQMLAKNCDVICLCVRRDQDIFDLLDNGLLAGAKPGTVIINHGTGTPENARQIARRCLPAGVLTLDIPVSGGRIAAEARNLTALVGGDEAIFAQCKPILESFSLYIQYMGDVGAGQYAKLFNNAMLVQNFATVARTINLASQCGLSPVRTLEALRDGSAFSNALSYLNTLITADTVNHHVAVLEEDMALFADAMKAAGQDYQAVYLQGLEGVHALPSLITMLNSEA